MKQVHWQLPFASLNGTQYRIDIYAEGAPVGGIRQLTGGATPFKTDEDNNDDFFAPVRSQTGCINIIDEDGTLMRELMPSDNVDKPVRLIRVSDGAVMWQGFLSCETYSQAYTSRPNDVTLNVNSVLEAMDSVEISILDSKLTSIGSLINYVLLKMDEYGANISEYYLPINSIAIVSKFIDTTTLFDRKEYSYGNKTYYGVVGYSLKETLLCICTLMGWTLREEGNKMYFTDADNKIEYRRFFKQGVMKPDGTIDVHYTVDINNTYGNVVHDMADSEWKGTNHTIDTRQGAKEVEVVASVKDYEASINLHEVPATSSVMTKVWHLSDGKYVYISGSLDTKYHSSVEIAFPSIYGRIYSHQQLQYGEHISVLDLYYNTLLYGGTNSLRYQGLENLNISGEYIGGAFYARGELRDDQVQIPELKDGMYFVFFPYMSGYAEFNPAMTKPIVKMRSVLHTRLNGGFLRIDGEYFALYAANKGRGVLSYTTLNNITVTLKVGNKYWNDTDKVWSDEMSMFTVIIEDGGFRENWTEDMHIKETEGHLIPVNSEIFGEIELWIWPQVWNIGAGTPGSGLVQDSYMLNEAFFSALNVDYVPMDDFKQNDRSENHYFSRTGSKFDEGKSVTTEFATKFSNNPSPSLIMNSETEPMTTMPFVGESSTINERPEVHMLGRMREYYNVPRMLLSLEMGKPDGPLPLVKITGFDGKTYLPLSESMDWKTGVSKIRCFEAPE